MTRGPRKRYDALIGNGALDRDPAQDEAVDRLQELHQAVRRYCRKRRPLIGRAPEPPRGIYFWGGVGRGKTLLMDLFCNNIDIAAKRRVHFHEFMSEVHERIAAWRDADKKRAAAPQGV